MHEIDLDLVGFLERLVALAQRPLDVDGVGDVLEGDQRGAVGQRHGGAIDHAAVAPLEPAANGSRSSMAVMAARSACQSGLVAVQRLAAADHRLDVRPLGQRSRRQLPQPREDRVEQPQAAVAAEHRDRLRQIVEGFALHPDQGIVAALQIQPLGDVVEQIGHAASALGVVTTRSVRPSGRCHMCSRASVAR